MGSEQLSFNWRDHQKDILNTFRELLLDEDFVDVTLACDGVSLEVHKMVLSACSPYFRSLFRNNHCKHPIVIMANVEYRNMKAIVDFMYKGEVNVPREHVTEFLKTANFLKIKGLSTTTEDITHNSDDAMENDDIQSSVCNDIPLTFQEKDSQLASAQTSIALHVSRSNSLVDSETECLQEISIYNNNESELMETVVVKSEPEDNYKESPNMESQIENFLSVDNNNSHVPDTSSSQQEMNPNVESIGRNQNSENRISRSISTLEDISSVPVLLSKTISVQTSCDPSNTEVLLPDNTMIENRTSITTCSGHTNDLKSQATLVCFEEPKVLVNYGMPLNGDKSPSKEAAPDDSTTSNSNNILNSESNAGLKSQATLVSFEEPKVLINYGMPLNDDKSLSKEATPKDSTTSNYNNVLNSESNADIISYEKEHIKDSRSYSYSPLKRKLSSLQNRPKRRRLHIDYTKFSKFGKSLFFQKHVISKPFNSSFDCKCTQKCASRISKETRMKIFTQFWSMENHMKQDAFIRASISQENIRYYKRKNHHRRNFRRIYKLGGIAVCYQMYACTLKINTDRINKVLCVPRPFGKHLKHRAIKMTRVGKYHGLSENRITEVIGHFDEFFNYVSHHNSIHVPVEFISNNLPLQKLYGVYKRNTAFPVTYYHFAEIFKNDFMVSLNKGNKDSSQQTNSFKDKEKQMEATSGDQTNRLHLSIKQSATEDSLLLYSNRETNQCCDADHIKKLPAMIENVHNSLDKVDNKETHGACKLQKFGDHSKVRKLTTNKIMKVINHFNKFYNTSSQCHNVDVPVDLSSDNPSFSKMYKEYKKDAVIPVSFYNYVKIFNTYFKHSLNKINTIDPTQQSNTNCLDISQQCNTNNKDIVKCNSSNSDVIHQHKVGSRSRFRKLTANKITKVIDHFKKFCNSTSQCNRIGVPVDLTSSNLSKMYKEYKKDVIIPVSFYNYVKIFNTRFKRSLNKINTIDNIQKSNMSISDTSEQYNAYNSDNTQQCNLINKNTTESSNIKVSGKQSLAIDKITEVIDHFNKFHTSTFQLGRVEVSVDLSSNDPPLWKMYQVYRKDVTVPVSYRQYVKIFNTKIKNSMNERNTAYCTQKSNTNNSDTTQQNNASCVDTNQSWNIGTTGKQNLPVNKITEVINHIDKFLNSASQNSRVSEPVDGSSSDPPLWKMYQLYRKDITVPVSYYHYVKIFNSNFKHSMDERNKTKNSKSCNTKVDTNITHQHNTFCKKQIVSTIKTSFSVVKQDSVCTEVCNSNKNSHQYHSSQGKQDKDNINKFYSTDKQSSVVIPIKQTCEENQIKTSSLGKESVKDTNIQSPKGINQESLDNISSKRITAVIDHFNEFHNFVSCHNETNVPLEFVNSNLPLMKMYKLYRADATEPVSYYHYFNIFRTNFKRTKDKREHISKSKDKHNGLDQLKKGKAILDNQNSEFNLIEKTIDKGNHQNRKLNTTSKCESRPAITTEKSQKSNFNIINEKNNKKTRPQKDPHTNAKCQYAVVCLDKIKIPLELQKCILNSEDKEMCNSNNVSKSDSVNCIESVAENTLQLDNFNQSDMPLHHQKSISKMNNCIEECHSNIILNNNSFHSKTNESTIENATSKCNALHKKDNTSIDQQCSSFGNNDQNSEGLNVEKMDTISKLLVEMIDSVQENNALINNTSCIIEEQNNKNNSLFTKERDVVSEELLYFTDDTLLNKLSSVDVAEKNDS